MASYTWPPTAGAGGVEKYANFAALPGGASDGDLAVTLDTDTLYIYSSPSNTWLPISAPGAPLSVSDTNSIDLTLATNVLSADLRLSGTAAGAGFFKITNSIDSGGLLSLTTIADTSTTGVLTATDWNTFNGKYNLPALTSGSVLFSDGTTIAQDNANFFWDNSTDRLGIGTSGPTHKLDVCSPSVGNLLVARDTVNNSGVAISTDSSGRASISITGNAVSSASGGAYLAADGFEEAWINLVARQNTSGQRLMRLGNLSNKFSVQLLNDAGSSITSTPFTVENSAPTSSLYINSTGNVGIGSAVPASKLAITGGTSYINMGEATGLPTYSGMAFGNSPLAVALTNYAILGDGNDTFLNRPIGGDLFFREDNLDQMILLSGGDFGIGTTAPAARLSVHQSEVAGTGVVDFVNTAAPTLTNKMRLRLGPSSGYVPNVAFSPYIEAYVEDATTQIAGLGFGTYFSGSTPTERMKITAAGVVNIPNLTASRAMATDGSSNLVSSATTATELGYVNGVTSAIQTQLDGKLSSAANFVANSNLAQMPTLTIKGNDTGGTADVLDLTVAQVNAMLGSLSNPMTTFGDIIYGGTAGVPTRLGQGTNGQFLVSGASAAAPKYQWGSVNSVSSANYTVTTTDGYDTIIVSTGASDRTVTLPAAASSTGRTLKVIKSDSGAGFVILDGNASETINGQATRTLYGQYADTTVYCDGTTWFVVADNQPTWMAYTPTFTGFGTPTSVEVYWRRVGANLEVQGRFTAGTVSGTNAGFSLPTGLTTAAFTNTQISGFGVTSAAQAVVTMLAGGSNTTFAMGLQGNSDAGLTVRPGSSILSTSGSMAFQASVQITGW
jgi:hypothetical protein